MISAGGAWPMELLRSAGVLQLQVLVWPQDALVNALLGFGGLRGGKTT